MAVCCSSVGATLNDEQQHNKKIPYIIDKYLVLAWALAFISSALLSFVCFADANRLSTKKKMKTWKHTSDGTERAKNYQSVSDLWTNERVSESGLENIALATANHGNNWCIIICRCARHFCCCYCCWHNRCSASLQIEFGNMSKCASCTMFVYSGCLLCIRIRAIFVCLFYAWHMSAYLCENVLDWSIFECSVVPSELQ